MAARTVLLNLVGQDRVSRTLRRVRQEVDRTGETVNRLGETTRRAFGGDRLRSFARGLGQVVKAGSKLGALAAGAGLAAVQVAQLAAALAPLAGLAAALPAVALGAAAAFGALKLALSGVGDAFSAALGGDAEKFEESLKGLSPAARAAARELRALRPQFLAVKDAAQEAFFGPLQGQIRKTASVLAGPLKSGVQDVAGQYGAAARQVLAFTRESRTVSTLRTVFDTVTASLQKLRPAITPVLRGFRDMAAAGSSSVEQMAGGLGSAGARFGQWMQEFAASGGVQEVIGGAVDLLKQLGGLLKNLGGIFASLGQAASAAGGGIFGVLGAITGQLDAFLKTAAGQQGLKAIFEIFNLIGQTLAPIVPIIGHVVAALASALAPVIRALAPIVDMLVAAIGRIVRALTPILAPLGAVIASLLTGLMPILSPMIDLLAQTAEQIGGALVEALTASLPSVEQIALAIASLLPELMPLVPLWAQWLTTILPLLPILTALAATLIGYLVPVARVVIQVVMKIWTTIAGFVIPVFEKMVQVVAWVAGLVQPILSGIWVAIQTLGRWALWLWEKAIQPAFKFIATLAKWLFSIIVVAVIGPIIVAFKVLASVAQWLWKSVLKPVFSAIGGFIAATWRSVIKPALDAVVGFLRATLGPVFRWIYDKVIRPVWRAVGAAIDWVWRNAIRPAFNAVRSGVEKLAGHFRNAVKAIGRAWDGLKSAAKKPVSFVVNTVFNKGIVKIWNAVAGLVPGVGKLNEIKGFARGGVYPGYTPGRDIGLAAVSGGEAIMRPEFTRAVGQDFIESANASARRGGTTGVAKFLAGVGDPSGVPGFAGRFFLGGIVGKFADAAKGFFSGGLVKTARRAFGPMLDAADGALGGMGGFGRLMASIPHALVSKILAFFAPLEEKIGGPGKRAVRAARSQLGVPYSWGGGGLNGPSRGIGRGANTIGFDCSALMRYGWYQAVKKVMPRTTYGQIPWVRKISDPVPGALGFPHSGHVFMASDKPGRIIEAPFTGAHVRETAMRHASWGLPPWKFDRGGMLQPGLNLVANQTRAPEPVLTSGQWSDLHAAATGGGGPLVSIGEVVVKEKADVDLLADRLGFAVRSAAF